MQHHFQWQWTYCWCAGRDRGGTHIYIIYIYRDPPCPGYLNQAFSKTPEGENQLASHPTGVEPACGQPASIETAGINETVATYVFILSYIFIHNVYIQCARKLYLNVYLYEIQNSPLQSQKNNREIEIIVNECILSTIRENIPISTLLKVYLDETTEDVLTEEIKEEIINKNVSIEVEDNSSQHIHNKSISLPDENIPSTNNGVSLPDETLLEEQISLTQENITMPENKIMDSFPLEEVSIDNLLDEKKNENELPDLVFDEIDFI